MGIDNVIKLKDRINLKKHIMKYLIVVAHPDDEVLGGIWKGFKYGKLR